MTIQERITKIGQGLRGITREANGSSDYETADNINRSVRYLEALLLDLKLELESSREEFPEGVYEPLAA